MLRPPAKPPRCRRCRRGPADGARFAASSRSVCLDCRAIDRDAKAARLAILKSSRTESLRTGSPLRCKEHLSWIRSLPCHIGGRRCLDPTDAHHVREGGEAGTGLKPGDDKAVPLCHRHHMEGHTCGWATFHAKYRVKLLALAGELARLSPPLAKRKIPHSIASTSIIVA